MIDTLTLLMVHALLGLAALRLLLTDRLDSEDGASADPDPRSDGKAK
ncbi:hypothetical protein OAS19_03585 [Altererythrobacter sp.]|nr:hypothetical protein [Altererythrobacter sp.]